MIGSKWKSAWAAMTGSSRPVARDAAAAGGLDQDVRDGLQNVVAGLGTNRDKRSYATYGVVTPMAQVDLDAIYEGTWLGGKIVDIPAGDMCREWVSLNWDGKDEDEKSSRAIESAEARLAMRDKVLSSTTWGRLYGGAVMVIGIRGEKDMALPLDVTKVKKGQLENLTVFDRWRITPEGTPNEDMSSPNHGLPDYYLVSNTAVRLHWTRVVRFGGRRLPFLSWLRYGMWDAPVLQHVMDSVSNYFATRDGIASMTYEAVIDVLKTKGLFDMLGQKDGEAKLTSRFQVGMLMKGINRTLLLDLDREEYEQKTMQFAGVTDVLREFATDVCGAADIPMTRLFGQSPAGMTATGESDLRNYYDKIKADQERSLRPQLARLYEVVIRSELGKMPENFSFTFNPLWQLSETEQATADKTRAETDVIYVNAGILTEAAVAKELLDRGTYETMTEDDVDLAEELAAELEVEAPALVGGRGLARGGARAGGGTVDPNAAPGTGEASGEPTTKEPGEGATVTPIAAGRKAKATDSQPGDKLCHEEDGWHAYAGDKHIGGPYATMVTARRRMRQYDRRRG